MELARNPSTQSVEINQVQNFISQTKDDVLAVEEPLEIRLEFGPLERRIKKTISITMRTPGNDFELAVGFLFTEGILQYRNDLEKVEFCGPSGNVVRVELKPEVHFDLKTLERHFYTSSSCGVCGKTSIEALKIQNKNQTDNTSLNLRISPQIINGLPQKLLEQQSVFNSTGGIHGCASFSLEGELLALREDVGRHNALDKLIGFYFLNEEIPLSSLILLVSGRVSFELVQKASLAGFKIFAAVGAPSSLAVELAKEANMTLAGFVREKRFNIYAGQERIQS